MTGLEKMMNQILEEANASANSKRAEAAAEADRIKAAAEAEAEEKAAELKQFSELGVTRFFKQSQERAEEEEKEVLKQLEQIEGI